MIGTPPLLIIIYFPNMIDPDKLYNGIVRMMAYLPLLSSKIEKNETGDLYYSYVDRYFRFSYNELPNFDARFLFTKKIISFADDLNLVADSEETLLERPLCGARLTKVKSGCIVSFAISHAIADGETLKYFGFTLMMILNNQNVPEFSNQKQYGFQKDKNFRKMILEADNLKYKNHPLQQFKNSRKGYINIIPVDGSFVSEQLSLIDPNNKKYTANDIIVAHIIKNYSHLLLLGKSRINIRIPVNIRPLCNSVDNLYVGNAFVDCFLSWSLEELLSLDISKLVPQIHHAVGAVKDQKYLEDHIFIDENGINYDKFQSEYKQGFDPDNDVIISSVGDINDFPLDYGGGVKKGILMIPHVPNAFVVHRNGKDYSLHVHSLKQINKITDCSF